LWEVYWGVLGEWYLVACNSEEEALELQDDLLGYAGYVDIEVYIRPALPVYLTRYAKLP
jgi:hypothetical protein